MDKQKLPQDGRDSSAFKPHTSHWGAFSARWMDGKLDVRPFAGDPDPNRLIENFPDALRHRARVVRPMIRKGWLERGPGPDPRRGSDDFVAVSWEEATSLLAKELSRVRDQHGANAVFGGSYGWSSAGRFHHAQSQIHRFLNTTLGGYVRSVNTYSSGASSVLLPHIIGEFDSFTKRNVTWDQIVEHTDVVIAFGGMALRNSRVAGGHISRHIERNAMHAAQANGCKFILVGPLKSDLPDEAQAEWISLVPGTDTALMLGIVHTLVVNELHDRAFLDRFTVGWTVFEDYLLGKTDGQPKDAPWAAAITGVPAEKISSLARQIHGIRSLIVVAHSLQRAEHGEQPVWMGAVLSAALGQLGLPGGGYAYSLGAIGYYGRRVNAVPIPTLPQGRNGVSEYIPVARIADMLLQPGTSYRYNGKTLQYPHVRLVYWAGGNPFHHHQDLNRLKRAFAQLDTLVVHEIAWTATARHADFVLPSTMTLERDDIGASSNDPLVLPMPRVVPPFGEARDDFEIFSDLARRLDRWEAYTEGRNTRQWLEYLYEPMRVGLAAKGFAAPTFHEFWQTDGVEVPQGPDDGGYVRAFRNDPDGSPLATPSGRLEIFSKIIHEFNEESCPGHPAWLEPIDAPSEKEPFILVANQPAARLHSQLDFGGYSAASKHRGREVMTMNIQDATTRGIEEGDIVRIFNVRGACLAAVHLDEGIRGGVVQLATGAWYDPADPSEPDSLCVHGNPNVLTRDIGTSNLAQGSIGQLTTVNVEKFRGNLPEIRAYEPPLDSREKQETQNK